ncbi:hypothetical protein [Streptosporangium subroseum]|uniref:hypothetical protein n=1 Tax=Streptosporangium subroseum TaxID=106412 RepID=UPI003F4DE491
MYKERDAAERCINKIKDWRGLATRYDKAPTSYLAWHFRPGACGLGDVVDSDQAESPDGRGCATSPSGPLRHAGSANIAYGQRQVRDHRRLLTMFDL